MLSHFDSSNNHTMSEILDLILEMEYLMLKDTKCRPQS